MQPAYLSQVLMGAAHINLDQAANMAEYWSFSELEGEYFLNLVSLARASSPHLARRLKNKLYLLRQEAIANPLGRERDTNEWEEAATYYSDWLFSAMHILLRVPKLQEVEALSRHLKIPAPEVKKTLQILAKIGLAQHSLNRWTQVEKDLHANKETIFSNMHHRNWFLRAAEQLRSGNEQSDLRYTAIHSLSEKDFEEIKKILEQAIEKTRQIVKPSKDEMGASLTLSWSRI